VLYEAAGALPPEVYARGTAIAAAATQTWRIPVRTLAADPREHARWLAAAVEAVESLLTPPDAAR
jgi:hypothetical protein